MKINKTQSGSTLFVVLILMVVLTAFIGGAYEVSTTLERNVQRSIALQQAQAIGNAAVEVAFAQWKKTCIASQTLQLSSSSFATIAKPENSGVSGTTFNTTTTYYKGTTPANGTGANWVTISNYGVVAAGANFNPLDGSVTGTSKPTQSYDQPVTTGSGTLGSSFYYIASADVTVPVLNGTVTSKVRRIFRKKFQNPFQYAIYYNDDIESRNPPTMSITGKVFTNANIWICSGNTITFNDTVNYAGGLGYENNLMNYNNPGSTFTSGSDPRYYDPSGTFTPSSPIFSRGTPSGMNAQAIYNAASLSDSNNGNLNNIYHDLIEIAPIYSSTTSPTSDPFDNSAAHSVDPTNPANFRLYNQADLALIINSTGAVSVQSPATSGTAMPVNSGTFAVIWSSASGATTGTTNVSGTSVINSGSSSLLNTALVYAALMGGTVTSLSGTTKTIYSFVTSGTVGSGVTGVAALATSSGTLATTSFTDKRQSATVNLTSVNVGNLTANLNNLASVISSTTALIYLSDARNNKVTYDTYGTVTGTTGSYSGMSGFRLTGTGGSYIPLPALTLASSSPVYVQGDFNTNGSPPSNTSTSGATYNSSSVVDKLAYKTVIGTSTNAVTVSSTNTNYADGPPPTAIVADAITILSNGWSDGNATASLSSRAATATTINAAFMTGVVPTNGGVFSGGIENFPRFLESWSNTSFTYHGSMVEMFKSSVGFKSWKDPGTTASVYNAPNRVWSFDTNFLSSPPPGFNYNVVFSRYQWFLQ